MQNDYLSPQQLHFRKQNNTAYTALCVVSKNHFENDFFAKFLSPLAAFLPSEHKVILILL